jgi:hypothetical protein
MRRAVLFDGVEFVPGKRFRVVREGCSLHGMVPKDGYRQGWKQALHVGDIIECTGYGRGWGSDPGYGVEWCSEKSKAAHAQNVDFYPEIGIPFLCHPRPGFIEPVTE